MSRFQKVLAGVLIAIIILPLVFYGAFIALMFWAARPVTDPARYSSVLTKLRSEPLFGAGGLACFPAVIPAQASNVQFNFQPNFGQGGDVLELSYNLPSADVAALAARISPLAQQAITGDEIKYSHPNVDASFPFSIILFGENTPIPGVPPPFTVYVMQSSPDYLTSNTWVYICGIAINEQKNQVVYWMEDGN